MYHWDGLLDDVFRYLLRSDRTFIEIEEELKIVRAYLEIEELRLGSKLRTELDVDESVLRAAIPLLSIQPLGETPSSMEWHREPGWGSSESTSGKSRRAWSSASQTRESVIQEF